MKISNLILFVKRCIILFQSDENDDMSLTEKKHQLIKDYLYDHFCGSINYPYYSEELKRELEETLCVTITKWDIEVGIDLVSEDMFSCAHCGWTCESSETATSKDGENICSDCAEEE